MDDPPDIADTRELLGTCHTPPDGDSRKFYCPICMWYFSSVYKTGCCGPQYICQFCVREMLDSYKQQLFYRSRLGHASHLLLSALSDYSSTGLPLDCPYCSKPLELRRVENNDKLISYQDSPSARTRAAGLRASLSSPVKTGDSFDALALKLRGFETEGYQAPSVELVRRSKTARPGGISRALNLTYKLQWWKTMKDFVKKTTQHSDSKDPSPKELPKQETPPSVLFVLPDITHNVNKTPSLEMQAITDTSSQPPPIAASAVEEPVMNDGHNSNDDGHHHSSGDMVVVDTTGNDPPGEAAGSGSSSSSSTNYVNNIEHDIGQQEKHEGDGDVDGEDETNSNQVPHTPVSASVDNEQFPGTSQYAPQRAASTQQSSFPSPSGTPTRGHTPNTMASHGDASLVLADPVWCTSPQPPTTQVDGMVTSTSSPPPQSSIATQPTTTNTTTHTQVTTRSSLLFNPINDPINDMLSEHDREINTQGSGLQQHALRTLETDDTFSSSLTPSSGHNVGTPSSAVRSSNNTNEPQASQHPRLPPRPSTSASLTESNDQLIQLSQAKKNTLFGQRASSLPSGDLSLFLPLSTRSNANNNKDTKPSNDYHQASSSTSTSNVNEKGNNRDSNQLPVHPSNKTGNRSADALNGIAAVVGRVSLGTLVNVAPTEVVMSWHPEGIPNPCMYIGRPASAPLTKPKHYIIGEVHHKWVNPPVRRTNDTRTPVGFGVGDVTRLPSGMHGQQVLTGDSHSVTSSTLTHTTDNTVHIVGKGSGGSKCNPCCVIM